MKSQVLKNIGKTVFFSYIFAKYLFKENSMFKSFFSKGMISAAACAFMLSACGDDSSSSTDPTTGDASSSSAASEADVVAISDKTISGVSQKGPFVKGSSVEVFELDENLKQTGKSFTGDISSDDGVFEVESVELASQYALLKASGYYRNEVTGKNSSGTIKLNAITDLSDREKVNVNLLTHLEYGRALYLVKEKKLSVAEAKAQAEKEIFKAFGISGEFASSEDLNIFSKGDANAALLAISIILQGDRSEADLTELLTSFSSGIEKDGTWDDEKTKVKLADWALSAEASGKLDSIRANIKSWKLGDVPAFEGDLRKFYADAYGLEECNDKNKGVVAGITKTGSTLIESNDVKVICKDGKWVSASYPEMDTYGLAEDAFKDGSKVVHFFRRYHENKTISMYYVYDAVEKKWREALDMEGHSNYVREADSTINSNVLKIKTFICEEGNFGKYAAIAYRKPYEAYSNREGGSFYCNRGNSPVDGSFYEDGVLDPNKFLCDEHIYKCTENGWEERNEKANAVFKDVEPDIVEAAAYYSKDVDKVDGRVRYVPEVMRWIKYDAEVGWMVTGDGVVTHALNDYYAGCTLKKAGDVVVVDGTYYFCVVSQSESCTGGECVYGPKIGSWDDFGKTEKQAYGKVCETVGDEQEVSVYGNTYNYVCTADGWKKKG